MLVGSRPLQTILPFIPNVAIGSDGGVVAVVVVVVVEVVVVVTFGRVVEVTCTRLVDDGACALDRLGRLAR